MLNYMATYRNTDKNRMITFSKASTITILGGDVMKRFNQSAISESVKPCSITETIKRKRDVFGIIGTSAVIAEPKPEGKPCPSAR